MSQSDLENSVKSVSPVKKQKAPSLSEYEKSLLLDLVNQKKSVVESKKSDFGTKHKKDRAWEWISEEFGKDIMCFKRSAVQLKKSYENVKSRAKREYSAHKKEVRKTGGGAQPSDLSNATEKMLGMIPDQMTSLENEFDCDANHQIVELDNEKENETPMTPVGKPTNHETVKRKRDPSKTTDLDPKAKMLKMEQEEHDLRMKRLELEMKFTEEEHELKLQFAREEHHLKLKILEAQLNETFKS